MKEQVLHYLKVLNLIRLETETHACTKNAHTPSSLVELYNLYRVTTMFEPLIAVYQLLGTMSGVARERRTCSRSVAMMAVMSVLITGYFTGAGAKLILCYYRSAVEYHTCNHCQTLVYGQVSCNVCTTFSYDCVNHKGFEV